MVHSIKHYVQISISEVATISRNIETVALSVERTLANLASEVAEGSTIKAVYLELWVLGKANSQNFIGILVKQPAGLGTATFAEMTNLHSFKTKKNILYTTQGLAPNDGVGQPVPIYKGWIKIPKSKQRFGLGDALYFILANQGDNSLEYCGFLTYKEYT